MFFPGLVKHVSSALLIDTLSHISYNSSMVASNFQSPDEEEMAGKKLSYERGPIMPPSEAKSLPLRMTRNCPWNQCLFCRTYKKKKFSLRTVAEIKEDITSMREMADHILDISMKLGCSGKVNRRVFQYVTGRTEYSAPFRNIAVWMYFKTGTCFLQDADNLILKSEDLVAVLEFLRQTFPEITRVTTYSRSRTVIRKSFESLKQIHDAGLDRVHVGMESGSNRVLEFVKKGVTAQQHVEAGRRLVKAGMEVSEYVMPGLGGRTFQQEHVLETVEALNQINPHFIRLRSLRMIPATGLHKKAVSGHFTLQTDDAIVEEIRLLLTSLNVNQCIITSDHLSNLLEGIQGEFPEGKTKMLNIISRYQSLSDANRLNFRVGRRGGAYTSLNDFEPGSVIYDKIEKLIQDISSKKGIAGVEKYITELAGRYI